MKSLSHKEEHLEIIHSFPENETIVSLLNINFNLRQKFQVVKKFKTSVEKREKEKRK